MQQTGAYLVVQGRNAQVEWHCSGNSLGGAGEVRARPRLLGMKKAPPLDRSSGSGRL